MAKHDYRVLFFFYTGMLAFTITLFSFSTRRCEYIMINGAKLIVLKAYIIYCIHNVVIVINHIACISLANASGLFLLSIMCDAGI